MSAYPWPREAKMDSRRLSPQNCTAKRLAYVYRCFFRMHIISGIYLSLRPCGRLQGIGIIWSFWRWSWMSGIRNRRRFRIWLKRFSVLEKNVPEKNSQKLLIQWVFLNVFSFQRCLALVPWSFINWLHSRKKWNKNRTESLINLWGEENPHRWREIALCVQSWSRFNSIEIGKTVWNSSSLHGNLYLY